MVIVLRIFEELSFDEIGKKLNITASTARSQYVRGVQKLKNAINERHSALDAESRGIAGQARNDEGVPEGRGSLYKK